MKSLRWCWITALLLLLPSLPTVSQPQQSKITALNPLGQPPAIVRVPMAPRIESLEGKTIYIVDIGFTDTHQLFTEMQSLLRQAMREGAWGMSTGLEYVPDRYSTTEELIELTKVVQDNWRATP